MIEWTVLGRLLLVIYLVAIPAGFFKFKYKERCKQHDILERVLLAHAFFITVIVISALAMGAIALFFYSFAWVVGVI